MTLVEIDNQHDAFQQVRHSMILLWLSFIAIVIITAIIVIITNTNCFRICHREDTIHFTKDSTRKHRWLNTEADDKLNERN